MIAVVEADAVSGIEGWDEADADRSSKFSTSSIVDKIRHAAAKTVAKRPRYRATK